MVLTSWPNKSRHLNMSTCAFRNFCSTFFSTFFWPYVEKHNQTIARKTSQINRLQLQLYTRLPTLYPKASMSRLTHPLFLYSCCHGNRDSWSDSDSWRRGWQGGAAQRGELRSCDESVEEPGLPALRCEQARAGRVRWGSAVRFRLKLDNVAPVLCPSWSLDVLHIPSDTFLSTPSLQTPLCTW